MSTKLGRQNNQMDHDLKQTRPCENHSILKLGYLI